MMMMNVKAFFHNKEAKLTAQAQSSKII